MKGARFFLLVVSRFAWRVWCRRSGMIAAVDVCWGTIILGCCDRACSGAACTGARTFPVFDFFVVLLSVCSTSVGRALVLSPYSCWSCAAPAMGVSNGAGAGWVSSYATAYQGSLKTSARTACMYNSMTAALEHAFPRIACFMRCGPTQSSHVLLFPTAPFAG